MIRFVASDIDGTLLQEGMDKLSPRVFEQIERLRKRGVLFAAASGRQYANLRRLFAPVWKDILLICENGALVMYHGEVVSATEIPRPLGMELMRDVQAYGACEVLLSGRETCYVQPKDRAFVDQMLYTTKNTVTVVDDLCAVDEPFLKISVYDPVEIEGTSEDYFQQKWSGRITGRVAGKKWLDFTISDKGTALALVRKRFGFAREEMMAFGDNFNDEPMLRAVGRAYVMEQADPRVKALTTYHTSRVEDTLELLLSGKLG